MAKEHVVAEGDCISSIADQYGFYWNTLWDHAQNAELKALRGDPNTLVPGDRVHVPDKRLKEEARPTGSFYRFQKRGVPALCRLQLFDGSEYRANQPFEITIDGRKQSGVTDHQGVLEVPMPPRARQAHLVIGEDRAEFVFEFGALQPAAELAGVQARLRNLGFECGERPGELDDETRAALRAFQATGELPVTGEPDDATRAKLEELHDGVRDMPARAKPDPAAEQPETEDEQDLEPGEPAPGGN